MRQGQPRVAALALVAALLAPWPASASRVDDLEREASAVEGRVAFVERTYDRADESALARARRKFSDGETQFLLGDWLHAAVLLLDAVDQPEFRATSDYPLALAYLGDAFRNRGACGAALGQYETLLGLGNTPARAAAVLGTLDCRVKLKRLDGLDAVVAEAQRAFAGSPPPEVAYLAAKAAFARTDLAPAERRSRVAAAFAAVPPPYHLAAAYFQGVLHLEAGDLDAAAGRFEHCTTLQAKESRQAEVRELCALALGRIYAEQGKWAESLDRYQAVPRESPRFNEALYEVAWDFVRARNFEQALRTATMIVDLAPESQLAPEATILTGHLNLRLGRYAAATEAFNKVINAYAPVRDEIDAILTMHEDPIRYFDELISRQGKAFDVASVLPAIAVKWATAQKDVGGAIGLVTAMDGGRDDVDEANTLAVRLEALLERAGGLDAAPLLKAGWTTADAVETGVARVRGEVAELTAGLVAPALPPAQQAELAALRARRLALQPRLDAMPRSPEEVAARLARMRARVDAAGRAGYQLGFQVDAAASAIAGTEAWIEQHRAEIASDEEGRSEFADELRRHRAIVAGYLEELRDLRQAVAVARDAASGTAALADEARLRRDYLEAVEQERALVEAARPALPPAGQADLARGEAVLRRLEAPAARAAALKARFAEEARRRAEAVRARVAAERELLTQQQAALDAVAGDAREVVGRISFRAFNAVRSQFYKLVLKADVGVIDVAWSRKRERLEKIQRLAQEKASELDTLDHDSRLVLREVD